MSANTPATPQPIDTDRGSSPEKLDRHSLARASSPLSSIKRWRSPVLVIQADDDHNVPFNQTVQLVTALREQKVPHELIVVPNEIHDLLLHRSWLTYFHAQSDFLDKHLLR
jgi:dipeptidyl aminopeptidase/acylaminoacyl peptidase